MGSMGGGHRLPTAEAVGYVNIAAMRLPPHYTLSRRLSPSNHSHSIVAVNRLPSRCCRGRLSPPVCEAHRGSGKGVDTVSPTPPSLRDTSPINYAALREQGRILLCIADHTDAEDITLQPSTLRQTIGCQPPYITPIHKKVAELHSPATPKTIYMKNLDYLTTTLAIVLPTRTI